jgi:hypothetical protein
MLHAPYQCSFCGKGAARAMTGPFNHDDLCVKQYLHELRTQAEKDRLVWPASPIRQGRVLHPRSVRVAALLIAAGEALVGPTEDTAVTMSVRAGPEGVELCIRDDGRGFDPAFVPPDHFGLRIMRERIDTIGATLAIDCARGHGTQVVVRWADIATSERS